MTSMPNHITLFSESHLTGRITSLVSKAAAAILKFESTIVAKRIKSDHSPVTAADDAAQSIIMEGLSQLLPGVPVISEEMERPALGIVWRGLVGQGAERLQLLAGADTSECHGKTVLRTRRLPKAKPVIAVSRSHFDSRTEKFVTRLPHAERFVCGSSLKFCLIAEGGADLYPRLAATHEWDIAAGHAIVVAAGGAVVTQEGMPMAYGRAPEDFRVDGFIAFGDVDAVQTLLREPG